jgi:precorrin-6B methylase 2
VTEIEGIQLKGTLKLLFSLHEIGLLSLKSLHLHYSQVGIGVGCGCGSG